MRQESGTDEAGVGLLLVLKVLKEADEAGVEGIGLHRGSGSNPSSIPSANPSPLMTFRNKALGKNTTRLIKGLWPHVLSHALLLA